MGDFVSYEENLLVFHLDKHDDVYSIKDLIPYFGGMEKNFYDFAGLLQFPITVVLEKTYVDKDYRDCYYHFYASKHFEVSKNCQRITLFEGDFSKWDFTEDKHDLLQDSIIGTITIRPIKGGAWGRTLIDPRKLHQHEFYVRTTTYKFILNGLSFTIRAYPFASQDGEMMKCAETSIWTILNYFGTRYSEYRTVLPSEIISTVGVSSMQRVLPSQGLDYLQKSNLLKKFGFSPKVYSRDIYDDEATGRMFHYYVESGIPIAISLSGHSTVCIGHARRNLHVDTTPDLKTTSFNGYRFIDSADLHNEYVMIDDNQYPYKLEIYDNFSIHKGRNKLVYFTVPLYKRIFLEANAAKRIFDRVIEDLFSKPKFTDVQKHWDQITCGMSKDIVERVFLTSSRKYKAFRINNASTNIEKSYYSNLLFPKFIWVMELSSSESYENDKNMVYGEIVLDATSSNSAGAESIIMIRIGKIFSFRMPDESFEHLKLRIFEKRGVQETFLQYNNNLLKGGDHAKS